MLFFIPGLFCILQYRAKRWYFIGGILLGFSLMMKLNLAYAVLGIAIWIGVRGIFEKRAVQGLLRLSLLGLAVILSVGATFLPYLISGIPEVWTDSVILAPLAYSSDAKSSIFNVLPLVGVLFVLGIISWKRKWIDFRDPKLQLLAVVITGIVFSFLKSGKVNGHYLLQLYPFLLILIGVGLSKIPKPSVRFYPLALLILVLLPFESYSEMANVIRHKRDHGTFFNGEGFSVPDFIRKHSLNRRNVLFFEYHIGYWFLEAVPPSKAATHPSNICRPSLYPYFKNPRKNALEELEYLLDGVKPETVVTRMEKTVYDKEFVEEDAYVRSYLSAHYKLVGTSGRAEIFKRSEAE
jgi:hypothetical protein